MLNLKILINDHEDWLTERVVHYAQKNGYTRYSSTLREAWRISVCGLSKPLIEFIDTASSSDRPVDKAIQQATDFGIAQGIKHRSLGIERNDFIGLLKLYRDSYVDLVLEKEPSRADQVRLQKLILKMFDSMELGVLATWDGSKETEQLTELKRRNRELSNEKNKYLTVFESIAEPAILLNEKNTPTHVNIATTRLLLGKVQPGTGYYGDLSNPFLQDMISKILVAVDERDVAVTPLELDTSSGKKLFHVSVQQLLDISKKFNGSVIILQDVTDYISAIEAARAADRAKSVFLDTLSHEIRTPINNILGLTGLIEAGDLPAPERKQLQSIRLSGEILSALIENVLGLSKAETNSLQLIEQDFDLSELCDALFQLLQLEVIEQHLTLERRIAPDVPGQLHGDSHKLRHILLNLLSNGLKFTEQGSVTLDISVEEEATPTRPKLRFEISDTGTGIPETDVGGLFEPFFQGENPKKDAMRGGSGLGLAISKHLVEFLGGELSYRPNPAGGSIFSFAIPLGAAKHTVSQALNTTSYRVLVVEDNPVNATVIKGYLEELGHIVSVVQSYQAAVEILSEIQCDIVITDYRLGQATGLEVAKEVRRLNKQRGKKIPVIVVTASLTQDISSAPARFDVDLILEKPFSRRELANALLSVSHVPKIPSGDGVPRVSTHLSTKDLNQLLSDLGFARCRCVVLSYLGNTPSLLSGMQIKLEKGDLPGAAELAHQLVSASGFVGARSIVRLAKEMKAACEAGHKHLSRTRLSDLLLESELVLKELEARWKQIETTH